MADLEIDNWTLKTSLTVGNRIKIGETLYLANSDGERVRVMVTNVDIDSVQQSAEFTCVPIGDID